MYIYIYIYVFTSRICFYNIYTNIYPGQGYLQQVPVTPVCVKCKHDLPIRVAWTRVEISVTETYLVRVSVSPAEGLPLLF